MSYRGRMRVVECAASMKAIDVGKARRILKKNDVYPESCFLDALVKGSEALIDEGAIDGKVAIDEENCWFSGNHVNVDSLAPIAHLIEGKLSGYFVGEDGSLYGGFAIENGRIDKRSVKVTLVAP